MKRINWLLFIVFMSIFLLLFVPIVTTKVEMKGWYNLDKLGDTIRVNGDGVVVTNNKYAIKQALVQATILDGNNEII
jgi:hypothetical protein